MVGRDPPARAVSCLASQGLYQEWNWSSHLATPVWEAGVRSSVLATKSSAHPSHASGCSRFTGLGSRLLQLRDSADVHIGTGSRMTPSCKVTSRELSLDPWGEGHTTEVFRRQGLDGNWQVL